MPAKKKAKKKIRCAGKTESGKKCNRQVFPPRRYCHIHKKNK